MAMPGNLVVTASRELPGTALFEDLAPVDAESNFVSDPDFALNLLPLFSDAIIESHPPRWRKLPDGERRIAGRIDVIARDDPLTRIRLAVPRQYYHDFLGYQARHLQQFGRLSAIGAASGVSPIASHADALTAHGPRKRERIRLSLLQRLFGELEFRELSSSEKIRSNLPVFRLHCPRAPGTEAGYVDSRSESEQVDCGVRFFGLGLGKAREFTIESINEYRTPEQCMEVSVEAELQEAYGEFWLGESLFMTGIRLEVNHVFERRVKTDPIPPASDMCGLSAEEVDELEREKTYICGNFDLSTTPKASVRKLDKLASGLRATTSVDVSVPIGGSPFSFKLSRVTTLTSEVTVRCQVPGGKRYWWYSPLTSKPKEILECYWSVT